MNFSFKYFSVFLLLLLSCSSPAPQVPYNKLEKDQTKETLVEMNREFYLIEDSLIQMYVDSSKINFTTSKSGMRYYIEEKGFGDSVKSTDNVTYRYTVSQLDGEVCEQLKNVVKTSNLERNEMGRGFREALKMLKPSGNGVFIMPSFLAYGVVGVPNCIPAWTPVRCDITLIQIEK